jgi:hypothetical protein
VRRQDFLRHSQKIDLGLIGIGDEAALEHRRRSGDIGQCGGDHSSGTGFRRGDAQGFFPSEAQDFEGERRHSTFLEKRRIGAGTTGQGDSGGGQRPGDDVVGDDSTRRTGVGPPIRRAGLEHVEQAKRAKASA